LATFEQCPLKFKYGKIDNIPDQSGKEALMGNFVHDVLELFYKLPPDDRTLQSARHLAAECWNKEWGDKIADVVRRADEIVDAVGPILPNIDLPVGIGDPIHDLHVG
jgi:RecB family exonuclease